MASITLKGIPDSLKEGLEKLANREQRSLNSSPFVCWSELPKSDLPNPTWSDFETRWK